MKHSPAATALLIMLFTPLFVLTRPAGPAEAFYQWEDKDGTVDVGGLVRGFGIGYKNPEDDFFYEDERDSGLGLLGRLLIQAQAAKNLGLECNAYQAYIPGSLLSGGATLDAPLDVERSAALEWSFSDDDFVRLAVDRLSIRWTLDRLDLTLGRQPVNLATTFYFTPNDFFAPFAAQTFYRVYKPGVDAVRAEVRLGGLSQLSLISVLGYERDPESDTGWSDSPEASRASYVGRVSTVSHNMEWALLGGTVRESSVLGGSIQGEIFQWLGIRAEGHYADPDDRSLDPATELSVGLEHRWENSLNVRLEQFYHGNGADSVRDYAATPVSGQAQATYLARNYTALGTSYEFTPLLNGEILAIANWVDHSYLFSLNALYSLSDEAELSISLGVPIGRGPSGPEIRSEFGLYPYSLIIEVRSYF